MGFTSMPNLVIGADTARIINIPMNNPVPTTIASGSSVITPTKTNPLTIEVVGSGDTTITHYFQQLKVSVVDCKRWNQGQSKKGGHQFGRKCIPFKLVALRFFLFHFGSHPWNLEA